MTAPSGPASSGSPGVRLRWIPAEGRFAPVQAAAPVEVVDSWLVADGRVRAFEAHVRRFAAACAERCGVSDDPVRDFMAAVAARLPAQGRWFPRVEFVRASGTPRFQLWLRPAPAPGRTVRLWLSPEPDGRTCPWIKGPDLDWLAGQRATAVAAGADEAVLLTPDGRVSEGATTSILWWQDGRLCAPEGRGSVLPGVTRSVLLQAASARGVPVSVASPRPAELDGLEVWAVNALHGIRPVTGWLGADIAPGPATRAGDWQRYLNDLAVPLGAVPRRTDRRREPADVGPAAWERST